MLKPGSGGLGAIRSDSEAGELAAREEALLADAAMEGEELRELITEGQERGYLTHDEVAARLEEFELSDSQLRDLHGHLAEVGVEVIAGDVEPAGVQTPDAKPIEAVEAEAAAGQAARDRPHASSRASIPCACTCARSARSSC